jgi:hypothetical protein
MMMSQRRGKYNAQPVDLDGYHFDSLAEYRRFGELTLLQLAGEIDNLKVHPTYELQPAFTHAGDKYRAISYEADFQYRDVHTGGIVVEDSKGFETYEFKLKKKLLLYHYPGIDFRIVKG